MSSTGFFTPNEMRTFESVSNEYSQKLFTYYAEVKEIIVKTKKLEEIRNRFTTDREERAQFANAMSLERGLKTDYKPVAESPAEKKLNDQIAELYKERNLALKRCNDKLIAANEYDAFVQLENLNELLNSERKSKKEGEYKPPRVEEVTRGMRKPSI